MDGNKFSSFLLKETNSNQTILVTDFINPS